MAEFVKVAKRSEIEPGQARLVEAQGKQIALFNVGGQFCALDNNCTHRGGPLADGMLIGEQVVCPLHAFRFHGASGECDQANVCAIEAFPAEVRDGTVFVTVPA